MGCLAGQSRFSLLRDPSREPLPVARENKGGAALDIPGSARVDRFTHTVAAIGGMLARPEQAPCSVRRRSEQRLGNDAQRQIATKIENQQSLCALAEQPDEERLLGC